MKATFDKIRGGLLLCSIVSSDGIATVWNALMIMLVVYIRVYVGMQAHAGTRTVVHLVVTQIAHTKIRFRQ